MQSKVRSKKVVRRKRSPEETRAAILDAAEALFNERAPDTVDLADVAKRAEVTRAVVTLHFPSHHELVANVIYRRRDEFAKRAAEVVSGPDFVPGTGEGLEVLIDLLMDRSYTRLVAWSLLRGSKEFSLFDPERMRGLIELAAMTGSMRLGLPKEVLRGEAEGLIAMVSYAAFGFALASESVVEALGNVPSSEEAAAFRRRLRVMIQGYLAFAGPRALPMS